MIRPYRVALVVHVAVIVVIDALAYAGKLPTQIAAVPYFDKWMHALGLGPIALWIDGARGFKGKVPVFPPLVVLAVAGAEELAQGLSPRRTTDIWDFLADVAGVAVFTAASYVISGRCRRAPARAT